MSVLFTGTCGLGHSLSRIAFNRTLSIYTALTLQTASSVKYTNQKTTHLLYLQKFYHVSFSFVTKEFFDFVTDESCC